MLSRLLPRPSHFRLIPLVYSKSQPCPHFSPSPPISLLRFLSSKRNNDWGRDDSDSDPWDFSRTSIYDFERFSEEALSGGFREEQEDGHSMAGGEDKPWSFGDEEEKDDDVFDIEDDEPDFDETRSEITASKSEIDVEEKQRLEEEEKQLTTVLEGPDRAFGDLMAASGITDEMLDTLIALKDFEGVEGLPPLSVIEDMRYEKNTRKSSRAEIERQKLEEIAKARVRQVDEKGRAYGTGRRKCSVARVWVQPGNGKFIINDKEFDVYFPMLDHRAALLRPFSDTKTLGLWDINCTVKGGGTTGQVGAIQLGISRALQNFEPELRPPLRAAGFLTRDPRVVERKKPGKAKARKSFQWVKR